MRDGYRFSAEAGGFSLRTHIEPQDTSPEDIWWRAENRTYASTDPYDEDVVGSVFQIELIPFLVTRRTPKGVWVKQRFSAQRFVLGNAVRQLCVPTKELALADLAARKKRHVQGCQARLRSAERAFNATLHLLKKET